MDDWVLREKILNLIKAWPVLVAIFVGSGILGGVLVHLFPPSQNATAELYIGVDITRVIDVSELAIYAKTEPFHVDDYKNWQLTQVSAISTSEEIAHQTLSELRKLDPYWDDVTSADFMKMQDLDWYDVGVWRMRIQAKEAEYALQGVKVWREVVFREISRLISEGEDVLEYEGRMRAADGKITAGELRLSQLAELEGLVNEKIIELQDMDSTQILNEISRKKLWDLIAGYSIDDPFWEKILSDIPTTGQDSSAYIVWLDEILIQINNESDQVTGTINKLENDHNSLVEDYLKEVREAQGLSASLYIEEHNSEPFLESYYPDSLVGIISSFVGLFAYIIFWVMRTEV